MSSAPVAGGSAEAPADEDSVTMLDVLQSEQELDEDADAVLGDADDTRCSYDEGYVRRQPLYACQTCSERDSPSGVCLACSYHCHEGHDLVELYTKRNFRCDCGGSRQPGTECRLTAKSGTNADNKYNQNFSGLYCTCHRPYPDPDDTAVDQMIQCVVCEDWYHGRHLGVAVPEDSEYGEMTCAGCVTRLPYLRQYSADHEMAANVKTEAVNGKSPPSPQRSSPRNCRLKSLKAPATAGALFWRSDWREHLCTCDSCKAAYERDSVTFLLDPEDSVAAYERRGRHRAGSYDRGMRALSSMERTQQVEVVSEYNDLKSELMSYLQKFAENKKVVRKEDIQEFFTGMKSRKRQRTEMSHFCR